MQSVPINTKVVSSNPAHGEVYSIQYYLIKFVTDLRQAGGFLRFPPPIKLTATIDITEILLKVILSTITHHRYTYTGGCSGSRVASYWMVKRGVRMYTRGDS